MRITKKVIYGNMGKTVCYSIPNFRYDESDSKLLFDSFRFYTPTGSQSDEQGTYFDVPADGVLIERDNSLNKLLMIKITKEGVEAIEILEGAECEPIVVGNEGDIVAFVNIPTDPLKEINCEYKEVLYGN